MKRLNQLITRFGPIDAFINDLEYRVFIMTAFSLFLNIILGLFNGLMGIISHSVWSMTMFLYYSVLVLMRFMIFYYNRFYSGSESLILEIDGVLFICLAFILAGATLVALKNDVYYKHELIQLVIVGAYTFARVFIGAYNLIKAKKMHYPILNTIRHISYVEAMVSLLSLQTTINITFLGSENSYNLNLLFGFLVCLMIYVIGKRMIRESGQKKQDE